MADKQHPSRVHFTSLALDTLENVSSITKPVKSELEINFESPAVALLTDFQKYSPRTIASSASTTDALNTMQNANVNLLIVINSNGDFTGVISSHELIGGRKITQAMHQHQINRSEVTVEMIQTKRNELHALSYSQISHASVGDLVETVKSSGDSHILITEKTDSGMTIRGLISSTDITRALAVNLNHPPEARSFSSICHVILGHDL